MQLSDGSNKNESDTAAETAKLDTKSAKTTEPWKH